MLPTILVTYLGFLLKLSCSSPLYNMQPAYITATIGSTGRNIRNLPCISRKSSQSGVCMFAIDCLKANGTHLGTCIDRFYFGSCCHIEHVPDITENTIDTALIPSREPPSRISSTTERPTTHRKTQATTTKVRTASTADSRTTPKVTTVRRVSTTSLPKSTTKFITRKPIISMRPTTMLAKITTREDVEETTVPMKITTFQSVDGNEVTTMTPASGTKPTTKRPIFPSKLPQNFTMLYKPSQKPVTRPRPPRPTNKPLKITKPTSRIPPKPFKNATKPYTSFKKPTTPLFTTSTTISIYSTISKVTQVLDTTTENSTTPSTSTTAEITTGATQKTTVAPTTTTMKLVKIPAPTTTELPVTNTTPTEVVEVSTSSSRTTVDMSSETNEVDTEKTIDETTTALPTFITWSSVQENLTTPAPPESATPEFPPPESAPSEPAPPESAPPEPAPPESAPPESAPPESAPPEFAPSQTSPSQSAPSESTISQPVLSQSTPQQSSSSQSSSEDPESWVPITTPDGWVLLPSLSTTVADSTNASTTMAPNSTIMQSTNATTPQTSSTSESTTSAETLVTFSSVQSSATTASTTMATTLVEVTTSMVNMTTPLPVLPENVGVNMSDFTDVCGRRMFPEARIVGGEKSSFGKWPWQISLRQWRTSTYLHKCGAALLNENWAITAAHCVDNVPPSDLLLRLGEHDLSTESEPYLHQERRVQIVASHPQFDPRTFEYDLALLRFYEPVQFQPNIIPVCVPQNDENFVGRTAYVTGWGRLYEDGPLPSILQEVSVPVINNTVCESMYRSAGYIEHIPNIFICAGWRRGGYDSCEGDSGGPMVIQRPDKRFLLAGVISWGIGCAEPNQPGVYTRISEFRDWINQILQF